MSSRILILSASVGAGHLRAAEAVELVLRETVPTVYVENIDVLQMTNAAFRRLYSTSYVDLVNKAPHLLGYFYDKLDQPSKSGKNRGGRLRLAMEKLNLRKLVRHLERNHWDLVINTHFLPAEIIASLRRDGRLRVPQVTATTDFETHRLWVNQPCDHYFTATDEGKEYLRHWGVPEQDITRTGIPIHPAFCKPKDRRTLRKKFNLDEDRPLVLQLAGGFGVGPIEAIYRALLAVPEPIQVVVGAGRNEKVKEELGRVPVPPQHSVQVIGFTTEMDEWMRAADLVVSKPGGLTTSEALAAGTVMVIINPIPGQETRNSDFLLESGAAVKVNAVGLLTYKVTGLLRDSERLARLRAGVARIARPRAAYDVVSKSLEFLRAL
ncbi:MAG: glycosyltransferase [Planctomycetes bacterium]|nr:glycosyltransferase [Planctomycetota bacterium]